MSRTYWTLSALFFAALAATVAGTLTTERPWSLVIVWTGVAVLVALYIPILRVARRDQAARMTTVAPDPWALMPEEIPVLATDELIATWDDSAADFNAGFNVQRANVTMTAIENALRARYVQLCTCGAPPGGTHILTCQEYR